RFHDNHSSIHNQSEIQGSQAHQVTTHTKGVHQDYRQQHRQWNDRSYEQSCPKIAQKQHQHKNHDQSPLQQVSGYGTDGIVYHFGTVQKSINHNTFGQRFLDLGNAFFDVFDDFVAVFAFQHHHYRSRYFLFAIIRHCSVSWSTSQTDFTYITN